MRRLALILLASLLAGCSSAATTTAATAPPPACAWYTPMTGAATGQTVTVTARGPACRSQALIRWIAARTGRPWASTAAAAADQMPVTQGTAIAQLSQGGTVVKIYQAGSAGVTDSTAGYLADAFASAGWTPQQVTGPGGPPVTPPQSPAG